MPNTEMLTLSKARSIRNRLTGRLAQAHENIETYNSVLVGQRETYGSSSVDVLPGRCGTASCKTA